MLLQLTVPGEGDDLPNAVPTPNEVATPSVTISAPPPIMTLRVNFTCPP
jgi:hypothetical protein